MAEQRQYDDPNHVVVQRSETFSLDISSGVPTGGPFRTRGKVKILAMHVQLVSVASGQTTDAYHAMIVKGGSANTVNTNSAVSTQSLGSLPSTQPDIVTVTLNSSNTLASLGDYVAFQHNREKGKHKVWYEYVVLPGTAKIGK